MCSIFAAFAGLQAVRVNSGAKLSRGKCERKLCLAQERLGPPLSLALLAVLPLALAATLGESLPASPLCSWSTGDVTSGHQLPSTAFWTFLQSSVLQTWGAGHLSWESEPHAEMRKVGGLWTEHQQVNREASSVGRDFKIVNCKLT